VDPVQAIYVSEFLPTPMIGWQGAILTSDLGYSLVDVKDTKIVLVIDYGLEKYITYP